ncbi:MAG: response regulator [Cytophagales bacterium]|nr:response regulator [Cytophagales bacterium]
MRRSIFIFCFFVPAVFQPSFGIQNPAFNHLSIKDGLSNPIVYSVFQDKDGFLWISTDKGLNRYDGYTFKTYYNDPKDSTSIGNSTVHCIDMDSKGNLWLGTAYGLSTYIRETGKFRSVNFDRSGQLNFIRAICVGSDSAIWLGSNVGLIKYDPIRDTYARFAKDTTGFGLSHDIVRSIVEGPNGFLWIGTFDGLNRFDPETNVFRHFQVRKRYVNDPINNLIISLHLADDPSVLWVGSQTGLARFDLETYTYKVYRKELGFEGIVNNSIKAISGPFEGELWLGTDEGLLVMDVDEEAFKTFRHDPYRYNSLGNDVVINTHIDRSGMLWMGTNDGLSYTYLNRKQFEFHPIVKIDRQGTAIGGEINAMLKQKNGITWIGGTSGMARIDPRGDQIWYHAEMKVGLASNKILDLYEDQSANLWACTSWGLNLYRPASDKFLYLDIQDDPRASKYVSSIIEYDPGKYIVGSSGKGLLKFDINSVRNIDGINADVDFVFLKEITVNDMSEGKPGEIWVASNSGEVYKYLIDEDKLELYFLKNQRLENDVYSVNCLYYDSKDQLWTGTRNGAYRLKPSSGYFEWVEEIGDIEIFGIEEDRSAGKLWMSTANSIVELDEEGKLLNKYMVETDLPIKRLVPNSTFTDEEGLLYFGGIDGYISFHPKHIHIDDYIPKTLITGINVDNTDLASGLVINGRTVVEKSIHLMDELKLKYDENSIEFSFSPLHYVSPKSNQFTYFLEHFDSEWRYTDGHQPYALYSNLKPGEYLFKVKGANPDGVWNEHASTVKVTIDPPWWASPMAFISYFTAILVVGIFAARQTIIRTRLKNELRFEQLQHERDEELHQLKMRFFTNISHEIKTPLTLILGPVDQMIHRFSDKVLLGQLNMMKRNATRLLRLINQIMDMRKLEKGELRLTLQNGDLVGMVKEICAYFSELSRMDGIKYSFSSSHSELFCQFDKDKIDKILFNLLSNAFKFCGERGAVAVVLNFPVMSKGPEVIEIAVGDSGNGIREEHLAHIFDRFYQVNDGDSDAVKGTGIGLSLSRDYARLHGGDILVESEVGTGSTFRLHIPMKPLETNECPALQNEVSHIGFPESVEPVSPADKNEKDTGARTELPVVLVVEDNHDMRHFIRDNLEIQFRILEAEDGKKGFELAEAHDPDIIISDIMMPKMNGLELCNKIKSTFETSHIPVILLTAKTSPENVLEGLKEGADDYITKPFFVKQLLARIENLVRTRSLLMEKFKKSSVVTPSDIASSDLDEEFIGNVVGIIEKHIGDPELSIVYLAKNMAMSHSSIYKKIKAITGLSGNEFIRNIRLKRAAQLLQSKRLNVSEVIFQVGFNNRSYFSKCFQEMHGMTPKQFASRANT